jgi:hypothetical protein
MITATGSRLQPTPITSLNGNAGFFFSNKEEQQQDNDDDEYHEETSAATTTTTKAKASAHVRSSLLIRMSG